MTNTSDDNRPRIIPAIARIDRQRKPTRRQRIRQHRQAQAWQRKAERPTDNQPPKGDNHE